MALNKEQQPVAWQRKLRKRGTTGWGEWKECTKAQADYAEAYGHPQDFEEVEAVVRPLYVSPHPEAVITEEMIQKGAEALRKMYHGGEDEPFHLMAKAVLTASMKEA